MHRHKRFDWDPFFGYRKRLASRTVLSVLLLVGFSPALGQELDWAIRIGGPGFDSGLGIAVDGTGNSYVTGRFTNAAIFGPGETSETSLTSTGPADFFLAKYRGDKMTMRLLRFCNAVASLWQVLRPQMAIAPSSCLGLEASNISAIFQALKLPTSGREPVVKLRER